MLVLDDPVALLDDLLDRVAAALELSPTQYNRAKDHYEAVGDWLSKAGTRVSAFGPDIYSQGSLRIGTTVKPHGRVEYDLDLVVEYLALTAADVQEPLWLLQETEARLAENAYYASILEPKNRCARLNYAGEFHMDVLPAVPCVEHGPNCVLVPDRAVEDWKASCPRGYAHWFLDAAQRGYAPGVKMSVEPLPGHVPNQIKVSLQRVVQLIKRWRDLRWATDAKRAPISVVITTLAADGYRGDPSLVTTMTNVLDHIVAEIDAVPFGDRLRVLNPTNPQEDFSERWDSEPENYRQFVAGFRDFRERWHRLVLLKGVNLEFALSTLFGADRVKSAFASQARDVAAAKDSGRLGVLPSSFGALVDVTRPGALRSRGHTFYGE